MKNILILFLLFISILTICSADDFFPDENDPVTSLSEFDDITTAPNSNDSTTFIKYDANSSTEVFTDTVVVIQETDEFGNTSSDINISLLSSEQNGSVISIDKLKGYSDSMKGEYSTKGSALFQTLGKSFGGINTSDMSTLTRDYILAEDANSSEARAILFNQNFYTRTRSLIANLKTINCYATRKLVNSYYCPLPGKENYFFGGTSKDSKGFAKEACEENCKIPVTCMYKNMEKEVETISHTNPTLLDGITSIEINVDDSMLGNYVEISIANKYKYDDNITINSNDYNSTMALEVLQNTNHGVNIDISYIDEDGEYRKLLTSYDCKLNELTNLYKIYLLDIRTNKIKIDFYNPYQIVTKITKVQKDERLESKLVKVKIKYVGNQWWFCPTIHFTETATDCSGEIDILSIGSQVYSVCITEERQRREPKYGAFYSQGSCQTACRLIEECAPTYKHLNNIDPYNIPESLKDIEIGCVDEPSNTSCTNALCLEKFNEDEMPYLEKSWTNDDEVRITVASGIPSQEYIRPRVNVQEGMSANDDEQLRLEVSVKEMSEISYINMLNSETYDLSRHSVSTNIPMRSSFDIIENEVGGGTLIWNLKPNSHDVSNGNTYYFYAVFDVHSSYIPNAPILADENGTIDPRLDRTILIKTGEGYKIVRRLLNVAVQLKSSDGINQWNEITTSIIDNYEIFNGIGFSSYDTNSKAEHFDSYQFSGLNNYESFNLYDSLESITQTPGVLFKNQVSQGYGRLFTRIYDGVPSDIYASSFNGIAAYGVYSKNELTYQELIDLTINTANSEYIVYSTKYKQNEGAITSDGVYNTKKVQMFITGETSNLGVNVDFTPSSKEEGKRTFIYMLLFDENSTQGND